MSLVTCQYSVIRFLPYRETEEFANVGVLLYCDKLGYLGHRVEKSKHKRITDFFTELDSHVFTTGIKYLGKELNALASGDHGDQDQALVGTTSDLRQAFDYLVRPRRTLFYFSPPRVIQTESPGKALRELFQYYVERLFAQQAEYQEKKLQIKVSNCLKEIHVQANYKEEKIGKLDNFTMPFPFVYHAGKKASKATKAIKPISFALEDTTSIWGKGDRLVAGFNRLRKWKRLPKHVLLPINYPDKGKRYDVAKEVCDALSNVDGLEIVNVANVDRIKNFARID